MNTWDIREREVYGFRDTRPYRTNKNEREFVFVIRHGLREYDWVDVEETLVVLLTRPDSELGAGEPWYDAIRIHHSYIEDLSSHERLAAYAMFAKQIEHLSRSKYVS